jgi:hypothetical protein
LKSTYVNLNSAPAIIKSWFTQLQKQSADYNRVYTYSADSGDYTYIITAVKVFNSAQTGIKITKLKETQSEVIVEYAIHPIAEREITTQAAGWKCSIVKIFPTHIPIKYRKE